MFEVYVFGSMSHVSPSILPGFSFRPNGQSPSCLMLNLGIITFMEVTGFPNNAIFQRKAVTEESQFQQGTQIGKVLLPCTQAADLTALKIGVRSQSPILGS
jgi:hypothetical protein